MMIRSHCYSFSLIIVTIFICLLLQTLASPTLHFCRPDQRDALLEFRGEFYLGKPPQGKTFSGPEIGYPYPVALPTPPRTVIPWNRNSDCCHWKGVTCDNKHGQVISLNLSSTFLNRVLKTNSSLFRLQYLRHLNLTQCVIQGEIPSSIRNLSHLTLVDLSSNYLVGEIPASLGNLSSLTFLDLSSNRLVGEIPAWIGNLNHLRSLGLEDNMFTGEIPSSLGNLSRLLEVDLSNNHLVGEIPTSLGSLNEVRVMSLGVNSLSGNIPNLLANLTKLSHLSLRSNNFTSTLPSDMSGFQNLEHFDVGENSLVGPFPKSLFLIPSLQSVDLGGNQFMGPIQFENTSSELWYLDLSRNRFDGPIPESISEFPNLPELLLNDNNFSGPIPRSITKLVNLTYINLSNNKLEGEVPGFFGRLTRMTLSHNFLRSFENPSQEAEFQELDLSSNSFRGQFPQWICKLKRLSNLDLSNNLFTGSIPSCLRNSIVSLEELILRNNSFSGVLPEIFTNATSLSSFDASRNQLEGNFPKSLINCRQLEFVNVENNRIKDKFPSWLGSLPLLRVLSIRSNEFYGPLYHRHLSVGFKSLSVFDVSHNDFTGILPPYYFSTWRQMIKKFDYFYDSPKYNLTIYSSMQLVNKGVETRYDRIREDFKAIDISGNRIYGKIPISISFLKELHLLNLSGNAFTNDIPRSLANLTKLEALDLSRNNLSGQIPQDLGKLSFLSYMNFSHNLLQGPVPRATQFQTQKCSSFLDNPGLYGLEEICPENHVPDPTSQQADELSEAEHQMFNWVAAAIAYGPGVFCGLVIGYIFTSRKQEWFTEKFGRR